MTATPIRRLAAAVLPQRSIVFVSTSLTHGGAEHQVALLAIGLARRGWLVRVVSMRPPDLHVEALTAAGVEVVSLNMARRFPDPRALVRLARLIQKWRPEVVHGHMVHANLLTRLTRLLVRIPVVVSTAHNIVEGPRWREVAYRLTEPLCDAVTNVSTAAVDRYIRVGAASAPKIRHIPNGVDTERFRCNDAERSRLRRALDIDDRAALLAVGRFEPAKDHATMLAALRLVADRREDAVLLLVGQGGLEQEIRQQVQALHLERHVRFLGTRSDVPALMNAADAYVMSSAWEGLPLVLLEAAAAGLPIVATDVGGNSEIVLPGANGLLVSPRDACALAESVLRVIGLSCTERRQWGEAGRALMQDEYGIETVLKRWESLYEELWSRKAATRDPVANRSFRRWDTARR